MTDDHDIKIQRDLFLAFAFASADLFIEVNPDGGIDYATGAAQSLSGIDHKKLEGKYWLDIFSKGDFAVLTALKKRAQEGRRQGPVHVKFSEEHGKGRDAILNAIKIPDSNSYHIAIAFPSDLTLKLAHIIREEEGLRLLDKQTFLEAANEALNIARSAGDDIDITLLDIPYALSLKQKLGAEAWEGITQSITEILAANSIDGRSAAQIQEGRYSVIHDKLVDSETLRHQIEKISKETDPNGKGFDISSKTVSADIETLNERETTKALIYTINEFDRKGTNLNIDTLNSSFKAYVSANALKIHQFKTMIEQLNFNLEFQPIADINAKELSHFEILSRFKGQTSTQEWVVFGEDVGMAADLDIAVCERVINYLTYKAADNRMKFAINLSGQSVQNEQFFKTLMAKLDLHKELANRMIFEITESTTITELDLVNNFINILRKSGFKVCLDDFGAGAASLQYIQTFEVDYIKIDGQYTRKILQSHRDQVLVKNLAQMCRDLNIGVIAEQVETAVQQKKMKELGIDYGQGYYYGYPLSFPQFDAAKIPAKPPT